MDKKSLSYHTKVQDWSQLYRLTADGKIYKDTKEITYLTPQKIQEIDSWRNNVRKKLNKKGKNLSGQLDLDKKRVLSAKQIHKGNTKSRDGAKSAGGRQAFSGTDIYSVSNHLAETSLHYSAMREDIYKGNKTKSISQPTKSILNGTASEVPKKIDKIIQFQHSVDKAKSSSGSQDNKLQEEVLSESGSETISLVSASKMTDRGKVIQVKDNTMISVRSASNNLLNVISIDDCKMALQRQPPVYCAHSEVSGVNGNKSELSEYNTNSAANSVDKHENRSTTMESGKTSTYYPSTMQSRSSSHPKVDRKARVTKAIDTMVNDRKVMNNMDRNFDARIAPAGRLVLERNEGGYMFKKLHTALRKHVDNILAVQAHRRSHRKFNGMEDQFSTYIQQIASTMHQGEGNLHEDLYHSNSDNLDEEIYRSDSKHQIHTEQLTIFEEDESNANDNIPKQNSHENINGDVDKHDIFHENKEFIGNDKYVLGTLTKENLGNGDLTEEQANSSGYECSSTNSSISIQNFSDKSLT